MRGLSDRPAERKQWPPGAIGGTRTPQVSPDKFAYLAVLT
jgi:hypothetical protein